MTHRPFRTLHARTPRARDARPGGGRSATDGTGRLERERAAAVRRPETFEELVARVSATRLPAGNVRVPPLRAARTALRAATAPEFSLASDDDFIEGYRTGLPPRVRSRVGAVPTATLDLHRLDAETARQRLVRFLASERARGRDTVLVIVGRGRHSKGGAVLRHEIAGWLTAMPAAADVLGFRTAPPALGGSGAVVVLLARDRGAAQRPR